MIAAHCCPHCDVDLDDDPGFEARCWKCGWTLRCQDDPHEYYRRSDAIAYMSTTEGNS